MLTPEDIKIAEQRAAGETLRNIENITGVDHVTAHRKLSRPEVKAYLDTLQEQIVNTTLPIAVGNIQHAIIAYKAKDSDAQLREHGFKASQRVMESVGLLPSHTQSILIQNIYTQNNVVAQDVGKLLADMYHNQVEDVQTITYEPSQKVEP